MADVIVVGGGIAGLVCAYRLAQAGKQPIVIESRGKAGGLIFGVPMGGITVDVGAESYARRSLASGSLVEELGLEQVTPGGTSWIFNEGQVYRIPYGTLGIPADITDSEVVKVLGETAAARAAQDLTLPPEIGADCLDLGSLVAARMGAAVVDYFVRPVAGGVHSTDPSLLAVETVAPGLREAFLRLGTLTAAVQELKANQPDGPMVAAPAGGLFRVCERLVEEIIASGGQVHTRCYGKAIRRDGDEWVLSTAAAIRGDHPSADPMAGEATSELRAADLVIALPAPHALDLLASADIDTGIGREDLPVGADLVGVTLVLDAPELDAAPRGSGVLVVPGQSVVKAKALTHYSVKWAWVRQDQPLHVIRVSYGRSGQPRPQVDQYDALRDASTILGVALRPEQLRGHCVSHFNGSLPPHTPEYRKHIDTLQQKISQQQGLHVVGSWVAGTGLAAVIPQAEQIAKEIASC
ncbi:MAG: protoporphyrinogen/coproporphyrinogen oxidase [Propionibacteriaceae bacterium]